MPSNLGKIKNLKNPLLLTLQLIHSVVFWVLLGKCRGRKAESSLGVCVAYCARGLITHCKHNSVAIIITCVFVDRAYVLFIITFIGRPSAYMNNTRTHTLMFVYDLLAGVDTHYAMCQHAPSSVNEKSLII